MMSNAYVRTLTTGALVTVLANAAAAGTAIAPPEAGMTEAAAADRALINLAFDAPGAEQASILNDGQMRETEGELWPFILSVAAVDIGLAGFFWGVYVPTVSGPCTVCDIGSKSR